MRFSAFASQLPASAAAFRSAELLACRYDAFRRRRSCWGLSSAGRAPDLHSGGQRFDPARLHQKRSRFARSFLVEPSVFVCLNLLRRLRMSAPRAFPLLILGDKAHPRQFCAAKMARVVVTRNKRQRIASQMQIVRACLLRIFLDYQGSVAQSVRAHP